MWCQYGSAVEGGVSASGQCWRSPSPLSAAMTPHHHDMLRLWLWHPREYNEIIGFPACNVCYHGWWWSTWRYMLCHWHTIYENFDARSRYLRQGYVIASHSILWDAFTYPCLRYLLLATKSICLCMYCQTSNIRCSKSKNLNVSCLILQLSLPNPLKPGVKSRMKM